MSPHEYRVVPAPRRPGRARGARRPEDRFARTVESEMNRMATEGWEYVRSDTLPHERRSGWFGRRETVFETVLVFRRAVGEARDASPAMPPPVALTPPAFVAAEGRTQAAPAATRFTPPLAALRPANDAPPAPPVLAVVEPALPALPPRASPDPTSPEPPAGPRHAAE